MSHLISRFRPDFGPYEALYKKLHANPELSCYEGSTASVVAQQLQLLAGVEIKTGIGGHGVVGVMRNGEGPVVMLRAELDALPVLEQTGLPYASTKRTPTGEPLMHACGHDMHMTALLASAQLLHMARSYWRGTVVFAFQPDEENGAGAKRMVDDGLYDTQRHAVPPPDIVLGGHVMPMRSGTISTRKGPFNSASESFRVTLYGQGGHGGKPHQTIDPIVMACSTVMKLQTIVSREIDPQEAAVVTVGSIAAGRVANVIPEVATLLVNTRSFTDITRKHLRASITRIVEAESMSSGSPKAPVIEKISSFPLLFNDYAATEKVEQAMMGHFGGEAFSTDIPISTGSEDIANLANPVSAAVCFWNYGGTDPKLFDDAVKQGGAGQIPANHSAKFAPVIQPTMTVATDAYALAALTFLETRPECVSRSI
ncbi:metal-dependent amidase/aminoacylase/carboxypeptidase [Rhypophila decipiens]|uniref:Metal-dependent amidase/aminoacylase/carboxypeptidase n=1 Tax=Rhypophila decipiens TaxID=261697 RepID=A0AAN6YK09_9PEZI|nr:metal-dependent amidase/aminoacylase/carboxypeptidase [Rhypophila decipiens]